MNHQKWPKLPRIGKKNLIRIVYFPGNNHFFGYLVGNKTNFLKIENKYS